MRIDGAPYVVDLTRSEVMSREGGAARAVQEGPVAQRPRSFDRVEISSQSFEVERLKRELTALPEVRLDRVALAKQNLQEGVYRLASIVLAQKVMEAYGIG